MSNPVIIKVALAGDVRRITVPDAQQATINSLHLSLRTRFSIAANRSNTSLKWTDSDGDSFTIATDSDLAEEAAATGKSLRFDLHVTETESNEPVVVPVAVNTAADTAEPVTEFVKLNRLPVSALKRRLLTSSGLAATDFVEKSDLVNAILAAEAANIDAEPAWEKPSSPTTAKAEPTPEEQPSDEHAHLRNFLGALHPEAEAHLNEALDSHPEAAGVVAGLNRLFSMIHPIAQEVKAKAEAEVAKARNEMAKARARAQAQAKAGQEEAPKPTAASSRCGFRGQCDGAPAAFFSFLQQVAQQAHQEAHKAHQAAHEACHPRSPRSPTSDPRSPSPEAIRHWGVTCDVTGQHPIIGARYHKKGLDYDLCEAEFNKLTAEEKASYERIDRPHQRLHQRLQKRVFLKRPHGPCSHRAGCRPTAAEQQRATQAVADLKNATDFPAVPQYPEPAMPAAPAYAVDTPREENKEESIQETHEEAAERVALAEAAEIADALCGAEEHALEAGVAAKVALLIDMGFGAEEVAEALDYTKGGLERAADFLFGRRQERELEAVAAFPVEWAESVEDLMEMGFEERGAREAIIVAQGDLKAAIKALVAAERESPA